MDQERYRQIKKKALILKNRRPYQADIAAYIAERNQIDWIASCLRLSGTPIHQEGVKKIMEGELLVDVSLKSHQLIHRYLAAMRHMQSMLEMSTDLTEKGLLQIYDILYDLLGEAEQKGEAPSFYRRDDLYLADWDYQPPGCSEIKEQMKLLFNWLALERDQVNPDVNPILRAVMLHNRIIALYPFAEDSATMARAAMLYELMAAGFPPPFLSVGEKEYICGIVLYLKKGDHSPLYDAVEEGVLHQLEVMTQLTAIR